MREENIRFGIELEEFLITQCGKRVLDGINMKISLMCLSMATEKHQTGDREGRFKYETLAELERARGFVMGLNWILDEWKGTVNKAKRAEDERKAKQKASKNKKK